MANGLLYSAGFEAISLTDAAQDIVFLATSSTVPIVVHEFNLSAADTTDVRARLRVLRRTTAGSGGTAVTARPLNSRNTVTAATTVTTIRTTTGTAGDVLEGHRWSLLVPFQRLYTPEARIYVPASGFLALELVAGSGATRTISGEVVFEEL